MTATCTHPENVHVEDGQCYACWLDEQEPAVKVEVYITPGWPPVRLEVYV